MRGKLGRITERQRRAMERRLATIQWQSVRAAKRGYGRAKVRLPKNPNELRNLYAAKRLQIDAAVAGLIVELKRMGFELYGSFPDIDASGTETRIKVSRIVVPKGMKIRQVEKNKINKLLGTVSKRVAQLSKELWSVRWLLEELSETANGREEIIKIKEYLGRVKERPNSMPRTLDEITEKLKRILARR